MALSESHMFRVWLRPLRLVITVSKHPEPADDASVTVNCGIAGRKGFCIQRTARLIKRWPRCAGTIIEDLGLKMRSMHVDQQHDDELTVCCSHSAGYHHNAIAGMTKPSPLESHTHPHLRNMQGEITSLCSSSHIESRAECIASSVLRN